MSPGPFRIVEASVPSPGNTKKKLEERLASLIGRRPIALSQVLSPADLNGQVYTNQKIAGLAARLQSRVSQRCGSDATLKLNRLVNDVR
jgi:hypothetical protein